MPKNLGPGINSNMHDNSPNFTQGGRRLWFQRGTDSGVHQVWISESPHFKRQSGGCERVGSSF